MLYEITPEAVNAYFTPLDYLMYLGAIFVLMVLYYEWKWARACKQNVLVLVQKMDGHGDFQLAPQSGGQVSLKSPKSNTTQMWPINELATIDVPYPGVAFIPEFLQKTIRMVIVSEEDWEPMLNRSPYREKIASPDVIEFIKELADSDPKISAKVNKLVRELSPQPTREMIASPAVLGNLMHEKITEAVITVNKEMLDSISGLIKRLNKLVNPTVVYIGLGLIIILLAYVAFQVVPTVSNLAGELEAIKKALGVVEAVAH